MQKNEQEYYNFSLHLPKINLLEKNDFTVYLNIYETPLIAIEVVSFKVNFY